VICKKQLRRLQLFTYVVPQSAFHCIPR